jgi:hypothetical protein
MGVRGPGEAPPQVKHFKRDLGIVNCAICLNTAHLRAGRRRAQWCTHHNQLSLAAMRPARPQGSIGASYLRRVCVRSNSRSQKCQVGIVRRRIRKQCMSVEEEIAMDATHFPGTRDRAHPYV